MIFKKNFIDQGSWEQQYSVLNQGIYLIKVDLCGEHCSLTLQQRGLEKHYCLPAAPHTAASFLLRRSVFLELLFLLLLLPFITSFLKFHSTQHSALFESCMSLWYMKIERQQCENSEAAQHLYRTVHACVHVQCAL